MGPWWYDLIYVPSKYPCSGHFIRVNDDFCGIPMSGIWIFVISVSRPIELAKEMVTGATNITDSIYGILKFFLFISLTVLIVLPFISKWRLILWGDRRCWQLFHIVAWGLAISVGVFWVIEISRLHWSWTLWGLWLYIGLAVSALFLETRMLVLGRRAVEKNEQSK
jgi:hypothetical protein